MSAASNADKLFWLAYCDLVRKQIGGDLGDTNAIFFGTKSQPGPPAGQSDVVPPAFTNAGIFQIADHLLNPSSLFFVPSGSESYHRSLIKYLSWVDLQGNPTPANLLQIKNAQETVAAAAVRKRTELKTAIDDFASESKAGLTGDQTLAQWISTGAPAYSAADKQYNAATAALANAMSNVYGPLASTWNTDMNRLTSASDSLVPIPGINMPVTDLTPESVLHVVNNAVSGAKTPDPTGIYYRPAYSSPQYVTAVQTFMMDAGNTQIPRQTFNLSLDDGKKVDEKEFGQTHVGAGLDIEYVPWFSLSASGDFDKEEESFKLDTSSNDINIEISWFQIQKVAVSAGQWDIGNPSNTYKLKENAPQEVKVLVRPTQLLVASGVGYKVKFSSSIRSEFDTKFKQTQKAGGAIKIFGIPIGLKANESTSTEKTTHTGSWDSATGEFEVKPTIDAGFATVLAVIGEKIPVS